MDGVVVTAHQPNFLPGMSVLTKLRVSDYVIWLDDVQYTKGGWTNRNKTPNGAWLTVPVERHCAFKPIREVLIGGPTKDWRPRLAQQIRDAWGDNETVEAVCTEIERPWGLLVGLNVALLDIVVPEVASDCRWAFQSHLDAGHAVVAVSDDEEALLPISDRLAMMVAELGGDVYLSGPSGRNYLNEEPFVERGIDVEYWKHEGPNPCVLDVLSRLEAVA